MNTLLLIGGAAAILLLGGKKKSATKTVAKADDESTIPPPPPLLGGSKGGRVSAAGTSIKSNLRLGSSWAYCKPPAGSKAGTYSAISQDGKSCVVFWKPETPDVVRQHVQLELDKLNSAQIKALCETASNNAPDQFGNWVDDKNREDFVKRLCVKLFPQIGMDQLPPSKDAPYLISMVWQRVYNIVVGDLCNFGKIT
jgi:hypothetical protein